MKDETEKTEKTEKKRPSRISKFAGKGKAVTVPLFKLNTGDTVAFEFTGETRAQKLGPAAVDPKTGKPKEKEPATVLRATDLDTGELVDVIAPSVLLSTLDREYPCGIAGKKLVLKISQRPDKKYHDVSVSEL